MHELHHLPLVTSRVERAVGESRHGYDTKIDVVNELKTLRWIHLRRGGELLLRIAWYVLNPRNWLRDR